MSVIGIDIGGTKIRAVVWDGKRVLRVREYRTPKNIDEFEKKIVEVVRWLSRGSKTHSIGIGAAGIMERTTWIASPNIPYIRNLDFRTLWPRSIRVKLDNDARCFARAELLRGAGRGFRSIFVLTIGTGVGRAYGRDGRILRLKKFEFPEAWEKTYQAIRDSGDHERLARFLAHKLSPLTRSFKPEVVVTGGGVLKQPRFWQRLKREFLAQDFSAEFRRSALNQNAGALGAALLLDP